ncbi:MAG: LacI family transcriptional regulator [Brevinematales bacterium]|nr:LacI family transcriptional regulator [Brevinematales bacterium]
MINSKEIAKIAGVSRSTVSRVINNYPNVPQKTKEKVLKVIREYNYRPNFSAKVLCGKKTNTIGIFVVSLNPQGENTFKVNLFQNFYFGNTVDALIDISNANGYYSLVQIIYKKDGVSKLVDIFAENRFDGGIIIGLDRKDPVVFDIARVGLPFVLIHYDEEYLLKNLPEKSKVGLVNSMDYEAGVQATEYLISLGHRDIGFISGRFTNYSTYERWRGFLDVMRKNSLEIRKEFFIRGDYLLYKTEMELKHLIKAGKLPTAFIVCNDDMALVTINVLKSNGIKVPDDVSLISFDNNSLAEFSTPSLTTFKLPVYEMSERAFNIIVKLIEAGKYQEKTFVYTMPMTLISRNSCKAVR